ncbi:hypothetical protein [Nonomuraea sp. 10N515B]|uniref:hypothetical protein n=1 Tax=Nonomuraea sp. 10N515B TaxID=3457422 RepID=UPI003FCE448B
MPPLPERLLIAAGASLDEAKQIVAFIHSECRPRPLRAFVSRMPDGQWPSC